MSEIRYSPKAQEDLIGIWNYIAYQLESPKAADNIIRKVTKSVRVLEQFPNSGASVQAKSGIQSDLRYTVGGQRIVVYRYSSTEDAVYILRVFGRGEDWLNSLFGSDMQE